MNKKPIRVALSKQDIELSSMVIGSTFIAEKIGVVAKNRQGDIAVEVAFPSQHDAFNWVAINSSSGVKYIAHELSRQYEQASYSYSSENPRTILFFLRR